jgi:hypothetical protein
VAFCAKCVQSVQDCCVTFSLHPIAGTPNYLIRQKRSDEHLVTLVAEIVEYPEGYTLYRMDATGELATELPTPDDALAFYQAWVIETNPTLEGIVEG